MTNPDPNSRHPFGPGSHAPLDNGREMPECYPIKGNIKDDGERLYHRPDSENYGATIAEVWFDGPAAAEAAGFVLAPTHPEGSSGADFEPGGANHPCTAEQIQGIRAGSSGDDAHSTGSGSVGKAGAAAAGAALAGGAASLAGRGDDIQDAAAGSGLGAAASDAAGSVGDSASDAARDVANRASEAATAASGSTADAATAASGGTDAGKAASGAADSASQAADSAGDAAKAAGSGAAATGAGAAMAFADTGSSGSSSSGGGSASSGGGSAASGGGSDSTELVYEGDADFERVHPYGWGSHAPLVDPMEMPWCYPIKGNAGSGKYHRPDSIGYPDTVAEIWFDSPSSAEAAGFVAAGSHPEGSNGADFEPGGAQHPCSAADIAAIRSGQAETGGKSGFGTGAKIGAAGAAAAGVAGAAALAGRDSDSDAERGVAASTNDTSKAETSKVDSGQADTSKASTPADASKSTAGDTSADTDAKDESGSGKKLAAGAAGVAAAGAAGMAAKGALDKSDSDTSDGEAAGKSAAATGKADAATGKAATTGKTPAGSTSGSGKTTSGDKGDKGVSGKAVAAGAAAGTAAAVGKAAASTGQAAGSTGKAAAATGKAAATTAKGATTASASRVAGSGGDDGDTTRKKRGAWWWWLLPLLLLALLLFFLFRGCDNGGGDSASTAAVAADPTETPTAVADDDGDAEAVAGAAAATEEPTAEPTEAPAEEPTAEPTEAPTEEADDAAATDEAAAAGALVENCPSLATDMTAAGYGTAANLVASSGLLTQMGDAEAITIFAPQDAVFEDPKVTELASNAATLASLLAYHVVDGKVASTDLTPGAVMTSSGENAIITKATNGLRYDAAGIVDADIASGECMVHGIDSIAVPASLSGALGLANLNDAISRPAIAFEGDTADLTDADTATLEALCAYIGTTDPAKLAPVAYRESKDADIDKARQDAVHTALADCGGDGITLVNGTKNGASFTG